MDIEVFPGNGMGPVHDFQPVPRLDEIVKIGDSRAGRITDNHSGGQMDDFRAVVPHFLHGVFDVSAGTPVA